MNWSSLSKFRSELMGIACLWVMLYHNRINWPGLLEPVRRFVNYGNLGVEIFLLLSGMSLYFAWQKQPRLKDFYARRLVRLLVPYLVFSVPYWIWRDLYEGIGDFWLNLTQLSLPLQGIRPTWFIPAMAVFYLAYPLIVRWIFGGRCPLRTGVLCGAAIAVCALLHYSGNAIYRNCEIALTRIPIFIIGCALGRVVYERKQLAPKLLPASAAWLVINGLLRSNFSLPRVWVRFSYIPLCLAICIGLIWLLGKLQHRERLLRFLRFFGNHSLELYLTHMLLRNVVYHYIPSTCLDPWGFVSYGLILAGATALGAWMHPWMERLSTRILNSLEKERL